MHSKSASTSKRWSTLPRVFWRSAKKAAIEFGDELEFGITVFRVGGVVNFGGVAGLGGIGSLVGVVGIGVVEIVGE